MIVSKSFIESPKARDAEFTTNQEDRPIVVQFAASSAKELADAAELVAPFADAVDLNCGCPQRWAMHEGYGAHLIQQPELVRDMVHQTSNRTNLPVTIKIRIHNDLKKTVQFVQTAEHAGVSWITVHGRTRSQRHHPVNYNAIKLVKENMSVPVVANGDIKSTEDADRVARMTGVDGVMAARGILQNPAMYAGFDTTPQECIHNWVEIAMKLGVPFTPFHQHLMYMLEKLHSKQEKQIFNSLSSSAAVLDYLCEHHGL
ncbi:tRNA-dihydrouridine(20a/20b) synthase [NAD(P)+]-like [Corticium candelabrum]|uniref:tRNA-dihydrouridine(20a/20b) synthase [NAD(P)+]-like n=1 Tax=Corticium candelabrum TaxID=121492 RepID=UPI002E274CCE|nr:tRNA-dihydrouridine(20a/20b) synthase [NAD(P)+]-like [Corticium candelabrum]